MNRKRRSFSKEFKREAVALVTEHGYSYAEAGRSLDVEAKLVGRWRRELEAAEGEAFPGKGKLPPRSNASVIWRARSSGCGWRRTS